MEVGVEELPMPEPLWSRGLLPVVFVGPFALPMLVLPLLVLPLLVLPLLVPLLGWPVPVPLLELLLPMPEATWRM